MDDVNVDLPDPFGPAITVNVGILLHRSEDLAENLKMGLAWSSGPKSNREPSPVRQLLHISAPIVHKYDGMAGSERILASPKTSGYGSLRELFRKNVGGRHALLSRSCAR
jgi:hypothetical protein